jgi:GNAT superfamily N-acetyltransferase
VKYHLSKEVMTDDAMRTSFNELAVKTFGISFEDWYQKDYWNNSNIPYTLFDGEKAVSNISVNRMKILWQGQIYNYIQLGTVMTASEYRNQGLSRYLMEVVMKDWESQCDDMFLFANKKVLDFYPKFRFKKELQYSFQKDIHQINHTSHSVQKLYMNLMNDVEKLKKYYSKTNPFSKLQAIDNYSLLMFYCSSPMKDFVYYSPQYDAIVIAEQDGSTFNCLDIYCDKGKNLFDILFSVAASGTNTINLEFTPIDNTSFDINPIEDDNNTLFLLNSSGNIFKNEKLLFPEISHT